MGRKSHRNQVAANDFHESRYDERNNRQQSHRGGYGSYVHVKQDEFNPLTEGQRLLASAIRANDATFAIGPAGTGKTHVPIALAVNFLKQNPKSKLILTNPGVEIGEKLGTLPGDKDEKVAVFVRPMRDIAEKVFGPSHVEDLVRKKRIIFEPLGTILGATYDDAIVVLDEAQYTTIGQMRALLTRLGKRSKVIVCGDYKEQIYTDTGEPTSGLEDAVHRFRNDPGVAIVRFTLDDVVRSDFCKRVIAAYRADDFEE